MKTPPTAKPNPNNNNHILYILFLQPFLILIIQSQKAIVFSSSIGYYNYRQTSNAFTIYHRLKQYGFDDKDITLMIGQNSGCCEKNPLLGTVSFHDNKYQPNMNSQVEIDFDYSNMNLNTIFNVLRLKYQKNTLNKVKHQQKLFNEQEDLFIFVTGHGQRQAIIDQHFQKLFRDLYNTKRFKRIFLMSDSCSAITPFETVDIENFTAFASSSFGQMSKSHGFDSLLNGPKSDDFTFYFDQYLEDKNPLKTNVTLKQLFKFMSKEKLGVQAKIVGKGKRQLKNINKFITKKNKVLTKQYRLRLWQ